MFTLNLLNRVLMAPEEDDGFASAFASAIGEAEAGAEADDKGEEAAAGQEGDEAGKEQGGDDGAQDSGEADQGGDKSQEAGDAQEGESKGESEAKGAGAEDGDKGQKAADDEKTPQDPPKGEASPQQAAAAKPGEGQLDPKTQGDQQAGQPKLDPATLEAVFKAMQGRNQQQEQKPAEGEEGQAKDDPTQKTWKDYLSDEDKAALDKYDQQWDEVSSAEQIRTNAMVRHAQDVILAQVNQALAPIAEHIQQSQVQSHFGRIREAHNDFDDLVNGGHLKQWVDSMSNPMVKQAAEQVIQGGTTDQVIALLDLYKEQNAGSDQGQGTGEGMGAAPAVPASSQQPASGKPAAQKPPKPEVKSGAAAATAAVKSGSRGEDPRGSDPNDFLAGFEAGTAEN